MASYSLNMRRKIVLDRQMREVVAYNFRRLMLKRGIKAKVLADLAGCDESYISQIITGKVGFGVRSEAKWAAIFKVDPTEFYKSIDPVMQEALELLETAAPEERGQFLQYMRDQRLLKQIKEGQVQGQ